jgi:hypothetical protein
LKSQIVESYFGVGVGSFDKEWKEKKRNQQQN